MAGVLVAALVGGALAAALVSTGGGGSELTGRTGSPAPPFSLTEVADPRRSVGLGQFAGTDLVVNFWASWCVPCQQEMPVLQRASLRLRGKVAFVGVDTNDTRATALAFLRRVGVSYPTVFDPAGQVSGAYGLFGLPTTVFVSARGTVLGRHSGQLDGAGLEGALEQAFGAGASARGAGPPVATPFEGVPEVGALFAASVSGIHVCTAAVVESPGRDLVVTAAHCIAGTGTSLLFVPMYHDGALPYGSWQVRAAYADPGWIAGGDPRRDVAFLALAPHRGAGREVEVQDLTGGYHVASSAPFAQRVTVVGYPIGSAGRPVRCAALVTDTGGFPTFTCGGFVAGTSGGPWVVGTGPGRGAALEGVVGGLHQGGCSADVSYSSSFGPWLRGLYGRAARGGPGDTLPVPGADGC